MVLLHLHQAIKPPPLQGQEQQGWLAWALMPHLHSSGQVLRRRASHHHFITQLCVRELGTEILTLNTNKRRIYTLESRTHLVAHYAMASWENLQVTSRSLASKEAALLPKERDQKKGKIEHPTGGELQKGGMRCGPKLSSSGKQSQLSYNCWAKMPEPKPTWGGRDFFILHFHVTVNH